MKNKIDINELLDAANGEGFSPEQIAGIALLLSEYRGEIDKALESLKEKLRVWAVSLKQDDETHLMFDGMFPHEKCGKVQVTFMGPQLKLKRGVDPSSISGLEELLIERVTYSAKKNVVELLGDPRYSELSAHFDVVESKPRVGFRKT